MNKGKKILLNLILTISLVLGYWCISQNIHAEYEENKTSMKSSGEKPSSYEKPKYEKGKINVNGYYVVANDGQLSEYLEWSFPYDNPLQEEGKYPDPGRPYRYVMWQSKKNANGSWGNWETRSPVDVDAKDGSVWILNVAPDSIAGSKNLENWMNTPTKDYDGTNTTIGRGVIKVKTITMSSFNAEPATQLRINPLDNTKTNEYQYSVIVFGTCDSNGSQDLSAAAVSETEEFYKAGGGVMFGHDTIIGSNAGFKRFAEKEYLNMNVTDVSTMVGHSSTGNAHVKVVDTGFLTSRPWNLEGKTLQIPNTHTVGQKAGGTYSDSSASQPRVWMQLSDSTGNVNSVPGSSVAPFTNQLSNGYLETNNYYLITNNRMAMIQTGHSNGQATTDEQMVIANTLIYLAQSTTTTTAKDASFIDEAKPSKAQGKVSAITPASDLINYTATIELTGSVDYGTEYAYRIQALPQTTISDGSDYNEIWSTTATDPTDPTVYRDEALSGLKGYYIGEVNDSPTPIDLKSVDRDKIIPASGSEDKITVETGALIPGKTYYAHTYAVDYQGNVSEDLVLEIAVSGRVVNFHYMDEDQQVEQTLLKSNGACATMPGNMSREGYRFVGWYTENEAMEVNEGTQFDESYGDKIDVYAKWIKTWPVVIGQRGEGEVSITSSKGEANPFNEGSDVTIHYEAAKGYQAKAIWLDGVEYQPDGSGKLVIPSIDKEHYVLVEFEVKEETSNESYEYYSIETILQGGGSSQITPSVRLEKRDPKCSDYEVRWEIAEGYEVAQIRIDGIDRRDLIGENHIRFTKVSSDHQIEITAIRKEKQQTEFTVQTELIGGPGQITPGRRVKSGDAMKVTSQVSDGRNYEIVSTKVYDRNGHDVSVRYTIHQGEVTLDHIEEDLKVVVELQAKKQAGTVVIPQNDLLRLTTSKSGEGEISESRILKRGDSVTVEWQAEEGWIVSEIIIDEEKIYYRENEDEEIQTYSLRVEENGDMPFTDIEENHSVHVTFEKIEEEKQEDTYSVTTSLVGSGVGTITSGNKALDAGADYPIQWETEKDHEVIEVWVNGELREDLKGMNQFNIEDIAQDYEIIVVVKRVLNIDTDGDGKPDINIDTDDDGKPDINIDTDDDGKPDINIVDKDGDGKPDPIDPTDPDQEKKPNVNVDTDGDGKPDINIDTDGDGKPDIDIVDKDGDGKPDPIDPADPDKEKKPNVNVDVNGDGKPDVNIDTDGDGKPDINIVDKDKDGKPDSIDPADPDQDKTPDVNIDTDGDGKPDINIDTTGNGKPDINIDTDNDGKADINIDVNNDGKADINIDTDGDGKANINIDKDGDGIADVNIDVNGDGIPDLNIEGILDTSDRSTILSYVMMIILSGVMILFTSLKKKKMSI